MRIGSLFSGIGGLERGLEIAGAGEVVWQCERDEWCRGILERHWPGVQRFDDVRSVPADAACDILCGGFPCQDVSIAGARVGITGEQSGLWYEFARLVRVLRPRVVFVENVPGLLDWFGHVLGPLAALGYDAEWAVFSAAEVGAPHRRERLFVLAHAQGERPAATRDEPERTAAEVALPAGAGRRGSSAPDADREDELPRARVDGRHQAREPRARRAAAPDAHGERELQPEGPFPKVRRRPGDGGWWTSVPAVCGGHDGPACMDRTKRFRALGNAVVPQQAALAWKVLSRRAGGLR